MGRPRGFDESVVLEAAAVLFARRPYDGISVDDLVAHLGVHRNSLYATFGSKRGLYLTALRRTLGTGRVGLAALIKGSATAEEAVRRVAADPAAAACLDLLIMAAVERAPVDAEAAAEVDQALAVLDGASDDVAALLGLRVRARAAPPPKD